MLLSQITAFVRRRGSTPATLTNIVGKGAQYE